MPEYMPIDEWAEKKHPALLSNIRAHVKVLGGSDLTEDDRYVLVRMIMASIREEYGR